MYIRIIREGDAANTEALVIAKSMIEPDIKAFYQQPWVMVASDGGIASEHPRGAGTFPRVLGVYVREKHWLTLPEAVRKMTSLPAQRIGWKDRGIVREGAIADITLFNPKTVLDRVHLRQTSRTPYRHRESLRKRAACLGLHQGHRRSSWARTRTHS